jgi:hypothetical protein
MRKLILVGVVGALLGGGVTFAAGHFAQAKPTEATPPANGDPTPRSIAEGLFSRLKDGKTEEFADTVKASSSPISDVEFVRFKKNLVDVRAAFAKTYGSSLGEFELVREQAVSPSVVRLVYVEKFEKNGMTWVFVMYQGKDGWKVASVNWFPDPGAALGGIS